MRIVVQRVSQASVAVSEKIIAKIGKGLLVFLGIASQDTEKQAEWLSKKLVNLRVFKDAVDKMNLSLKDIKGSVLVVSQFTLYGDVKKGNRPSFIKAALPKKAEKLYQIFIEKMREEKVMVKKGEFGAMMKINLINDGPVTLIMEK